MKNLSLITLLLLIMQFANGQVVKTRYNDNGYTLSLETHDNWEVVLSKERMSWKEAMKACKEKGDGWYIPAKSDLRRISGWFGSFKDEVKYLWSSNDDMSSASNYNGRTGVGNYDVAYALKLKEDEFDPYYKSSLKHFLMIHYKGNDLDKIFNSPTTKIGYLMVLTEPIREVSYYEIQQILSTIGNGWRLPSPSENLMLKHNEDSLNIIYESISNRKKLPKYSSLKKSDIFALEKLSHIPPSSVEIKRAKRSYFLVKGHYSDHYNIKDFYQLEHLSVTKSNLKFPGIDQCQFDQYERRALLNNYNNSVGWRLPTTFEIKLIMEKSPWKFRYCGNYFQAKATYNSDEKVTRNGKIFSNYNASSTSSLILVKGKKINSLEELEAYKKTNPTKPTEKKIESNTTKLKKSKTKFWKYLDDKLREPINTM